MKILQILILTLYSINEISSYVLSGYDRQTSKLDLVDKRAELEKIYLIGCCVATGFGNAVNIAKVDKGSNIAIWGLGAISLATALAAKECGAKRIIGVDINENKFQIAKKFGCNEFVNR